jgi:hypothetical protein
VSVWTIAAVVVVKPRLQPVGLFAAGETVRQRRVADAGPVGLTLGPRVTVERDEPPWLRWRLGLFVSKPGRGGLVGSVERCFELGGRDVVAVAVEAVFVEPVHPRQGLELELVNVVPHGRGAGSSDALGL